MVDRIVIEERLAALKGYVADLKKQQAISFDEFCINTEKQFAVRYALQLAIQTVLDMGAHLLAGMDRPAPTEYRDIIIELGTSGVLPSDFSKKIAGMAGLRNVLVHEYMKVDLKKVYDILHNQLGDFETFAAHIADFLKKTGRES